MVRSKKKVSHSKTMWFSLLLVIFGAALDNFQYLQDSIPPHLYGVIIIVIAVIVAILRFITTKPL